MSPVSLRIREFREAKGMSQEDLAEASGVPQSSISRLERRDVGVVNLEHLDRLARALGIHPRELILRSGDD
jgi:transcriptional regulator with XRE-family HTH domain